MAAINVLIDKLLLDSENPRIGSATNQREALQKILDDQEEKLFALAEDNVDEGLSPIDRLLVLSEKKGEDRFITLEGNRRVGALKILANPHVLTDLHIKGSLQRRFEELAGSFKREEVEPVGFCPAFTDTLLRLIMGQEGCHGTEAEVFSGIQA